MALQACLQLGWIIYSTYQPVLLRRFGFADLLPVFGLQGGFLGLVVEPLSGALSDRHGDQARGRLMPITVAVSVVGLIFLTTAALLRQGSPWFGPGLTSLMVLWVVAVQLASSPNLAQLNEAVPLRSLPLAVAFLTVSHGLIGAISGALAELALGLGPAATFPLGALVLALGLTVLRSARAVACLGLRSAKGAGGHRRLAGPLGPAALVLAALLLVLALAVGGLGQILLDLLPRLARSAATGQEILGPRSLLLLCSAIGAPFAARAVGRWGRLPALAAGVLLLTGVLVVSLVVTSLTAISLTVLPPGRSGRARRFRAAAGAAGGHHRDRPGGLPAAGGAGAGRMSKGFSDHFGCVSEAYAHYRPTYPEPLFAWLAGVAPSRRRAWDCATGTGQAAVALAAQLAAARPHPGVHFRQATAENSGLEPGSLDLVTVAQALHWFDRPRFFVEVERVPRPGGVLAMEADWSASARYRAALGRDPLELLCPALAAAWGAAETPRCLRWPLTIKASRRGSA